MKRSRSITVRLSLVFLFLFLVAILLGAFGIGSLSYFNDVSSQVRDRWLPSTGFLGDLNNHTSDFRGIEATSVLAATAAELAASDAEMQQLDRSIAASQISYRQIAHDVDEDALYMKFASAWAEYRGLAGESRFADCLQPGECTTSQPARECGVSAGAVADPADDWIDGSFRCRRHGLRAALDLRTDSRACRSYAPTGRE